MTESFESLGRFWESGSEERHFGHLVHDSIRGPHLDIVRDLTSDLGTFRAERPLIHGEVVSSPPRMGRSVTLVRALRTKFSASASLQGERWIADRVFLGSESHFEGQEEVREARVVFAHLADWLRLTGLQAGSEGPWTARFVPPPSIDVVLDGAKVTIATEASREESFGRLAFTEETPVLISPTRSCGISDIERRWLTPIQWFVSACLEAPPPMLSLEYKMTSGGWQHALWGAPDEPSPPFNPFHALLRPTHDDLPSLIQRFFEVASKRHDFLTLFFSSERPPRYVEIQLLVALECLALWVGGELEDGLAWLEAAPEVPLCLPRGETAPDWLGQLRTRRERLYGAHRDVHVHVYRLRWALRLALLAELGQDVNRLHGHPVLSWVRRLGSTDSGSG